MKGSKPVAHTEFDTKEDLPIGQIVRRHGERRLGQSSDDNALTRVQERLLAGFDAKARRIDTDRIAALTSVADGAPSARRGRRGLHLDVGARYLPLWVDTGFGRYGSMLTRSLRAHGGQGFQLDASLLKLWIEEELAPALFARADASRTSAPAPRAPELPRIAALPPKVAERIPPQAQQALKARREEVRQAMLAAVQGDTRQLAAITHGTRAAQILDRLQEELDQKAPNAAPITALDHTHLRELAQDRPELSVDAAKDDFTFEEAALQVLRTAKTAARRQMRAAVRGEAQAGAAPISRRPGVMAQRAEQIARRSALKAAQIFGNEEAETLAIDQTAMSLTPFEPTSLIALAEAPEEGGADISAPFGADIRTGMARVLSSISAAEAIEAGKPLPSGIWRDRAAARTAPRIDANAGRLPRLGSVGLGRGEAMQAFGAQALKAVTFRAPQDRRKVQVRWLLEGGAGVMLDGLFDEPLRDADPAPARENAPDAPLQPRLTRELMAAITAQSSRQSDTAPSASSQRPGLAPYDATDHGDFADIVAQGVTRVQTAQRLADAQPGVQARLQDLDISDSYLPALARGIAQIGHSVDLLSRMIPEIMAAQAPRTPDTIAPASSQATAIVRLAQEAREIAQTGTEATTRVGQIAESLAAVIREGYDRAARPGAKKSSGRAYFDMWWGQSLLGIEPESFEAPEPEPTPSIDTLLTQALGTSRVHTVAQLRQIVDSSLKTGAAPSSPQTPREAAPVSKRALQLFSPEKTLALLAPELESGGLLDPVSRRELATALQDMAKDTAPSAARPRRVRTSFGTLTVRMEGQRVVVDTEEISSNAPAVSLRTESHRAPSMASLGAFAAPTRQLRSMASTTDLRPSNPRSPAMTHPDIGAVLARLGGEAPVDVLLGLPARAERIAAVKLDPVDAEALIARLGGGLSREEKSSLTRAVAHAARRDPMAFLRGDTAGALVRIFAESEHSAEIVTALTQAQIASPALTAPPASPEARTSGQTASTTLARPSTGRSGVTVGGLGAALERLTQQKVARASTGPMTGDGIQSATTAVRAAEAMQTLLAEASDARVVGKMGKMAMAKRVLGEMSRADLSYVLPYLQRAADEPAVQRVIAAASQGMAPSPAEAERARRVIEEIASNLPTQAQVQTPARSATTASLGALPSVSSEALLDFGLSLGRSGDWLDATRRMGVAALEAREDGSSASDMGRTSTSAAIGAGLAVPNAPSRPSFRQTTGGGSFVTHQAATTARSVERYKRDAAPRRAAIERSLSTAKATGEAPGSSSMLGGPTVTPQALTGSLLRDLEAVSGALQSLGARPPKTRMDQAVGGFGGGAPGSFVDPAAAEIEIRGDLGQMFGDASDAPARSASTGGGRSGRVGIWFPKGVERMVQAKADKLVGGRGDFAATQLAPSLFSLSSPQGRRTRPQSSSGGGSGAGMASLDGLIDHVALGLRLHSPEARPAQPTFRHTPKGSLLAVGTGAGHSGPSWMTNTPVMARIERFTAELEGDDSAAETPSGGVRGLSGEAVQVVKPEPAPPKRRKTLSQTLIQRESRSSSSLESGRVQGQKVAKRELFTPNTPYFGNTAPPGSDGSPMARAAKESPSGGQVERAEPFDRKMLAHQSGVPSQENIEDMAREVLAELKLRWQYELERRGIE